MIQLSRRGLLFGAAALAVAPRQALMAGASPTVIGWDLGVGDSWTVVHTQDGEIVARFTGPSTSNDEVRLAG